MVTYAESPLVAAVYAALPAHDAPGLLAADLVPLVEGYEESSVRWGLSVLVKLRRAEKLRPSEPARRGGPRLYRRAA